MPVGNVSNMMMAPWWSHLLSAKQDGKVTATEVKNDIAPYQQYLNEPTYRGEIDKLLATTPDLRATSKAKSQIASMLGVFTTKPHLTEKPSFNPGSGVATPDGGGAGPSVSFKAEMGEGTAAVKTNAWYAGKTLFVQVYGEAEHHTQTADFPKDVSVDVPRPSNPMGTYHLVVVDGNGKVLAKGDDFSGAPPPVARPLGEG
jgi:hypothetical protein